MGKVKEILSSAFAVCVFVGVFGFIAINKGVNTINGVILVIGTLSLVFLGLVAVIYFIANRISFKKASEKEIKAEDDILLQATAFSQAALWIYLNLIPENENIVFLKWFVPSVAILFYCLRAYGKLKDSNKHRIYSMAVFTLVVSFSIYTLVTVVLAPYWKGLFVIDGVDLTFELFANNIAMATIALPILFYGRIRTRYGLT
jgi:hypothetical protein